MPSLPKRLSRACSDPALCRALLDQLSGILAGRRLRFMEVCGTHTVSLFQSGLRSLLPTNVIHLSGPGCPVCVTHEAEIALLLNLAQRQDVILATFGDLLRVPGPNGLSLKYAAAQGSRIKIVYSPLEALDLARKEPSSKIVFAGIGFETTAPAIAATILAAASQKISNFFVVSLHKLIAPVLASLLSEDASRIDAFLLPGHVATITGEAAFEFLANEYHKPGAISGFEPADILMAICELARQYMDNSPGIANTYRRAAPASGNPAGRAQINKVFQIVDSRWRGLGEIKNSGLAIRPEFSHFDAIHALELQMPSVSEKTACRCGSVLKGLINPPECPLFATKCSPANPVGPCMVSTEGSCAAWFKYGNI